MMELTQGSIITSLRCNKYPGNECMGIVVTARCDLVSGREKVEKVFYLAALNIKEWLLTDFGWSVIIKKKVKEKSKQIEQKLDAFSLDWSVMREYSPEEFRKVLADPENSIKTTDQNTIFGLFTTYLDLSRKKEITDRISFYSTNSSYLVEQLNDIFNGNDLHFSFIPSKSYGQSNNQCPGLIVDHQELDYLTLNTARKVEKMMIDNQNLTLSIDEKTSLNQIFFLNDGTGFSIIMGTVGSPWIEYLSQRFASMFSRIGVDNPNKEETKTIVESIIQSWRNA